MRQPAKPLSRLNSQRGSMMIEALVAAAILTITLLGVAPMFAVNVKSSTLNKERSAGIQVAQRVIEQLQNAGFARAAAIANRTTPTPAPLQDDLQAKAYYIREADGDIANEPKAGYKLLQIQRIYRFVENNAQSMVDDLIQVNVKINWPGAQSYSISMSTAMTRNGLE